MQWPPRIPRGSPHTNTHRLGIPDFLTNAQIPKPTIHQMTKAPSHPNTTSHASLRRFHWSWVGPALLAAVFVVLLGGLLWVMQQREMTQHRSNLRDAIVTAADRLRDKLQINRDYLLLLSEDELLFEMLVPDNAPDPAIFSAWLDNYVTDHPELISVMYVDASEHIRRIAPLEPFKDLIDRPLKLTEPEHALKRAHELRRPVYTRPFTTIKGARAFEIHVPVMSDGRCFGTFVGRYSCDRLLRNAIPRGVFSKYRVSLVNEQTGSAIVRLYPGGPKMDERLTDTVTLDPPGAPLALRLDQYGSGFWGMGMTLLTVLCTGLVVGMAWGMWQLNRHIARRAQAEAQLREARDGLEVRVRERTADLEHANVQLQSEMTERQHAEQRLREHQEQLAYVARVSTMGEMATSLAHEINQPLGAIASFAQGCRRLVDQGEDDKDTLRQGLNEIAGQAQRAGKIVHRMREFVSQHAPQKSITLVPKLTAETIELIEIEAKQAQVRMAVNLDGDLPPVLVDPVQIQQVLLNLMQNAIEAMDETQPADRRLTITAHLNGNDMIQISVADTGPGCAQEQLDNIFQAFYTTKTTGMGMGMSISRSIIDAHGGRLGAENRVDATEEAHECGLRVWFTLPIAEENNDDRD